MISVNYVELDLLRGGPRLPIEDMPDCDYYILVSSVQARPDMGLWPLTLRDSLPSIRVPVLDPKPEARLELQDLLHQVYDEAGYESYIYAGPPKPPLRPLDAAWITPLVPHPA